MNIEKTLQLIAESQLRAERRADKADDRADKADQRADRADQRADRADERMDRFERDLQDQHAKAMARIDEQHAKAMARADKADQRMDRFDKKLNATADFVRAGIKMVREIRIEDRKFRVEQREREKELDYKFNALMDSQQRNDEKFNRLLELLRRKNTNGHNRTN